MTAEDTTTSVIRVFSYEPGTKVSKQKRTLEFHVKESDKRTLAKVREFLLEHKVLGALDSRLPFCDANGAEVSDHMEIAVYLSQIVAGTEPPGPEGANMDAPPPDGPAADAPPKPEVKDSPKFYYKKKKVQTKTDDATQEFLKKKLDLKLRENPALSPLRAQLLQSAFQADKWTAAPAVKTSIADELSERDWSVITRANCLLSGQRLEFDKGLKNLSVERTPFTAFKIKGREVDSYEIAAPAAAKKGISIPAKFQKLTAHIPRFRVDDSSYVTVIETQNTLQSSMAKSSFSQSSIEASASGGFWGVSAAAKGGFSTNEKESSISANSHEQKQMHVVYNFPRVTVYLDADSLELTDEIKVDIMNVQREQTKESVKEFGEKYGHIFSRRVKLGGRLFSSQQSLSEEQVDRAESENNLKAAAAASVSGWGFSASVEASHEQGQHNSNSQKDQSFASNMSWEATGGNTVLCNDPPAWCGTVGNFRHWRIVEQGDAIPLTKLISTFPQFQGIDDEFSKIAGTNVLREGKYVRQEIQLIDCEMGKMLIALQGDEINPLKTALEGISKMGGYNHETKFSLEKTIADAKSGSVTFDNKSDGSIWQMERWVPKGESPKLSYGAKNFISNPLIPMGRNYLALTRPIPHTSDSGFLYPGGEDARGSFFLEPTENTFDKYRAVKDKDIVVLRVWTNVNTSGKGRGGYVMQGEFTGDNKEISKEINQVPAFGPPLKYGGRNNGVRIRKFMVRFMDTST